MTPNYKLVLVKKKMQIPPINLGLMAPTAVYHLPGFKPLKPRIVGGVTLGTCLLISMTYDALWFIVT